MDKVIEIHDIVKNYQVGSVIVRALRSVSLLILPGMNMLLSWGLPDQANRLL